MKSIKDVYKIGAGPSSSHTMGPEKAAALFKSTYPTLKFVKTELYGSLALTGRGHLTDQIIKKTLHPIENEVDFCYSVSLPEHENAMKMFGTLEDDSIVCFTVFSIGGGDIIVKELEDGDDNQECYPHNSFSEIRDYCINNDINLYDYIVKYDSEVLPYLNIVYKTMMDAIDEGLSKSGILPGELKVNRNAAILFDDKLGTSNLSAYAYAVNEQNASGGRIVTAPTCGACGILPSVLRAYKEEYRLDDYKVIEALAVAGLIGAIVKNNASISGAEAGCQAEVGTATSMAAGACVFLLGGNINEVEAACEIALEHQLGLTCDPVKGYVQIPCIQRNGIGASKASECAKLGIKLAKTEQISFDMIIDVMYQTGKDMAVDYRETATGGIAKYYEMREKR